MKSEKIQNEKEVWITRLFVEKPFIIIAFFLLIFATSLFFTFFFDIFKMNEVGIRDYLIWEHETVR